MIDSVEWSTPGSDLALGSRQVDIWRAWLDVEPQETARFFSFLTVEERSRANRFVFSRDRDRFVVARGTLRQLAGAYLRTSPADLRLEAGPYGKLTFVDHPHLRFNLAHSSGLGLYVFTMEREVGIDIERIQDEFASELIAERYFSIIERNELRGLPMEMRVKAFFLCWTRKEAFVKAIGQGLQIPLDSFDVSVSPNQPAKLRCEQEGHWTMRSFYAAENYIGSTVIEGDPQSVRFWDFQRPGQEFANELAKDAEY